MQNRASAMGLATREIDFLRLRCDRLLACRVRLLPLRRCRLSALQTIFCTMKSHGVSHCNSGPGLATIDRGQATVPIGGGGGGLTRGRRRFGAV